MAMCTCNKFVLWKLQFFVKKKKHAVTIGCLGHMLKSAELACDMVKQPMVTACFFHGGLSHS